MTRTRLDGLYLLLLGAIPAFLLLAYLLVTPSAIPMKDIKSSYYSARCLIQHGDPYSESQVLRIYRAEAAEYPSESALDRQIATSYVYPPTFFSLSVPFAMLPWGVTRFLWTILTAGSLLFAAILAWSLGAHYAPILSGILIGYLLANSEVLLVLGNPSGVALSLCVVAVWCFLRRRFALAGILCLAVSLALKPQCAGLIWLYFLLAGGVYARRALQTLMAAILLSLPGVLWVWLVAPNWMPELHSNIQEMMATGNIGDPSPASNWAHCLVNLQVVVSVFRNDPRTYNLVSYLICAPLLLLWAFLILRSRPSQARAWLAIAAIAPLSLLPVHHVLYDTKLLLLTVPACAMLWSEGGRIGRFAALINAAAFLLTGDISWTILFGLVDSLHLSAAGTAGRMQSAIHVFPVPLILLAMGIFYLWALARSNRLPAAREGEAIPVGG
jgi:hypothetical protein